jgi:hypothetical protein
MHAPDICRTTQLLLALALGFVGCGNSWAQAVAVAAPAASAASAAASALGTNQARVLEDDNVRIEETRQRGQAQRIRVKSKLQGVRDYDITVAPGGKDLSQNPGTVGKRSWSILDF